MEYFNWEVNEAPIYNEHGGIIKGYKQIKRDDNEEVLNVTTERYHPIANSLFNDVVSTFVEDLECKVIHHGEFANGKKLYVQFGHNEFVDTIVDGDENGRIKGYGTLVNSHDGSNAFKFFTTIVRIFCQNTFTAAVANNTMNFSAKHTKNHRLKIDTFTDTIEGITSAQKLIKDDIDKMTQLNSFKSPEAYAKTLYSLNKKPRPINRKNKQGVYENTGWTEAKYSGRGENIMKRYSDIYDMYGDINNNNWKMFNVTTDDIDHGNRPQEYGLIGNGNTIKSRAFNLLTK